MSEEYLREWISKADEDYEAATSLIRKRKRPTPNVVCFHCQQCAEKYLKAFLVQRQVVFPKTHDLRELRRLAVSIDPGFDLITDLLNRLTPYAIEFRYPGEQATMTEAKAAIKAMKTVRRFVQDRLDMESSGL
jgi:HEPN domain-containing protein